MQLLIESREELRNLRIRCIDDRDVRPLRDRRRPTAARSSTSEMGMDPQGVWARAVDAVAGRRYFTTWLHSTSMRSQKPPLTRWTSDRVARVL